MPAPAPALACTNHPGAEARYECAPCGKLLCPGCVRVLGPAQRPVAQCAACQSLATAVGEKPRVAKQVARALASESLAARLPGCFRYLRQPSLLITLGGLGLLVSFLHLAPLLWLLPMGVEAAVYFHIVKTTAEGKEELEAPDLVGFVDEVLLPAARYGAAALPMLLALVWYAAQKGGDYVGVLWSLQGDPRDMLDHGGPALLFAAGVALWPLLTVIAALDASIAAVVNPVLWVKTLRVLGGDYLTGAIAFYAVFAFQVMVLHPLAYLIETAIPIFVIRGAVALFVIYLAMALRGRILGELCRPYVD